MKSMTGYGRAEARSDDGILYLAEAQSYNKKQFELRVRLPRESLALEPVIRELASARFTRGVVTVRLEARADVEGAAGAAVIDEALAAAYLHKARHLQGVHSLPGEITISDLLTLPGVAEFRLPDDGEQNHLKAVRAAVSGALDALDDMRLAEGRQLNRDLVARLAALAERIRLIEPKAALLPGLQLARLRERLREHAGDAGVDVDDERLCKELVVFTDRCDVSEEITRLHSHCQQFATFLATHEPVGRGMEFLLQEMQREINTLGAKAAAADISPLVVEFKTELEKIREQVQNIE
jgi:uncharacterized protein (TIGR00255 family)